MAASLRLFRATYLLERRAEKGAERKTMLRRPAPMGGCPPDAEWGPRWCLPINRRAKMNTTARSPSSLPSCEAPGATSRFHWTIDSERYVRRGERTRVPINEIVETAIKVSWQYDPRKNPAAY